MDKEFKRWETLLCFVDIMLSVLIGFSISNNILIQAIIIVVSYFAILSCMLIFYYKVNKIK